MINVSTATPDYSAEAPTETSIPTESVVLEAPLLAPPAERMNPSAWLPAIRSYIAQHPMAAVLGAVALGFVLVRRLTRDR